MGNTQHSAPTLNDMVLSDLIKALKQDNYFAYAKIELNRTKIGDEALVRLVRHIRPHHISRIDRISLLDAALSVRGVRALARTLNTVQSNLGVRFLDLGMNEVGNEGMDELVRVLPRLANLLELRLCCINIDHRAAAALARVLPPLQNLYEIRLHDNNIGDSGMVALATGLRHLKQLDTLLLGNTGIGNPGVAALADVLPLLQRLNVLSLPGNHIGDEGAAALANRALPFMTGLKVLKIHDNPAIGYTGEAALAHEVWASRMRPYGLVQQHLSSWPTTLPSLKTLSSHISAELPPDLAHRQNWDILFYIATQRSTAVASREQWLVEHHPYKWFHTAHLFGFARDRQSVLAAYERMVLHHMVTEVTDDEIIPPQVREMWQNGVEATILSRHPMFSTDVCALILQYADDWQPHGAFNWARQSY